jgi:hypothetical protein
MAKKNKSKKIKKPSGPIKKDTVNPDPPTPKK